jgi:nucleotide-binding universal stress UspA family protein
MRILTIIDTSRGTAQTVRTACRLGKTGDSAIEVLPLLDLHDQQDYTTVKERVAAAAAETETTPAILTPQKNMTRRRLARFAKAYDLCVVGTHDGLGIRDFLMGDEFVRMAQYIETPTLVVRGAPEFQRVLWRIPFAPMAPGHERIMCRFLKITGAPVTLFLARPRATMYGYDRHEADDPAVRGTDEQGFVAEIRKRIHAATGYLPDYLVRTGIPEEVLLAEALSGGYDLIAVSARRRRGLGRLLADDLPYYVALHASVSVLMMH